MNTELEKIYARERSLELKRNYMYFRYGKGRYLVPIDQIFPDDPEADDPRCLSDNGDAAEKMYAALDGELDSGHSSIEKIRRALKTARERIKRRLCKLTDAAIIVFDYISIFINDREEAVKCLEIDLKNNRPGLTSKPGTSTTISATDSAGSTGSRPPNLPNPEKS